MKGQEWTWTDQRLPKSHSGPLVAPHEGLAVANWRQTLGAGWSGVSDGWNAGVKRRGVRNDPQETLSQGWVKVGEPNMN